MCVRARARVPTHACIQDEGAQTTSLHGKKSETLWGLGAWATHRMVDVIHGICHILEDMKRFPC